MGSVRRAVTNAPPPGTATHPHSPPHPSRAGLNAAFRGLGTESQVLGWGHTGFPPFWAEDTVFQDYYDCEGDG